MSSTHHFYTATGRPLPLPPKRPPSRHSSVMHLPTCRAKQARSTPLRVDSSGRFETPHGAEFSVISAALQRASQLGVCRGEAAHPSPGHSNLSGRLTSQRSCKERSSPLAVLPTVPQQPRVSTEAVLDDLNSRPYSQLSCQCPVEISYATPPRSIVAAAVPKLRSSAESSASMSRTKGSAAAMAVGEWGDNIAPAMSIEMSITRRSHVSTHPHSPPDPPSIADSGTCSAATNITALRYVKSNGLGTCHDDELRQAESPPTRLQTYQQQQRRSDDPVAAEATAHRQGLATSDTGTSKRGGGVSHDCAANEVISHSSGTRSTCNAHVGYEAPHNSSLQSNSSEALSRGQAVVRRRPTQQYTEFNMEDSRSSKLYVTPSPVPKHPTESSSQQKAMVALLPTPGYSTHPSLNAEDPLEMSTPIAVRVHLMSTSQLHHANSASVSAGTLEGTELLPTMPRLQGHCNGGNVNRPYRTLNRFIAYQPEAERHGLMEMMVNYAGYENALCDALRRTYQDNSTMLKAMCNRGPAVPLLKNDPPLGNTAYTPRRAHLRSACS
ncbi:hypothetical protein JKF63_05668 [Porcisia hertigi]|uniref:Uncharacterized protein n=1 Tax=Porcisia hertigi TaxID=2761500 RepID=A0A836LHS4_9TRYP|nr:hypothetical protein JKF63_05668 [Porcisia hertigi]